MIGLTSISAGLLAPSVVAPPALHAKHLASRVLSAPVAYVTAMVEAQVKRKVYPYSIVPGGAEDVREAREAMTAPDVKANYAGVDLAQLKQVKLTTNLTGYVSYRWGDHIFWTRKALTLRAGETIFTDGTHIVRGRCLNCYSAHPMLPVRPTEPTEKAFDLPVEMPLTVYSFPKLPVLAPELPMPPGELTPIVPPIVPALASAVGKTGGFWFPLIPIIPPIHHHPSSPPSSPTTPGGPGAPPGSPPTPPVTIVPEPRYVGLLLAGFFGILLGYRGRLRSSPERLRD
jgi:hypothetical protein